MRHQRGIAVATILYALLALAVLGAGWGVVSTYSGAIERAKTAEAEAAKLRADKDTLQRAHDDQLTENHQLRERQARTDQLLAERQGERAAAQSTEKRVTDAIQTALRARPETRAWADTPVPADVLASLRNTTGAISGAGGQDQPRAAAAQPAGGGRYPGLAREPD